MIQMAIETYCAEIEGLKQKLKERDRKIAKLEYENEKLHTLTDLQEANVNIMHENTMKLRKEIERCEERVSAAYELGYKESKSKLKSEIERLTEELATAKQEFVNEQRYYENAYSRACQFETRNAELQKQVDELTDKLGKVLSGIKADELPKPVCFPAGTTVLSARSYGKCNMIFERYNLIKKVIFNAPATIVFWTDGSKTVVKASDTEYYDKEKGLAMCIAKKYLGNEGNYYNTFRKYLEEQNANSKNN